MCEKGCCAPHGGTSYYFSVNGKEEEYGIGNRAGALHGGRTGVGRGVGEELTLTSYVIRMSNRQ